MGFGSTECGERAGLQSGNGQWSFILQGEILQITIAQRKTALTMRGRRCHHSAEDDVNLEGRPVGQPVSVATTYLGRGSGKAATGDM